METACLQAVGNRRWLASPARGRAGSNNFAQVSEQKKSTRGNTFRGYLNFL
jgi:hypothetical protein